MSTARILYRTRQFWNALGAGPSERDLEQVRAVLSAPQMALFSRMQPSEQLHSLHVVDQLRVRGETDHDLLVAALLHDVGKVCYLLSLWERVAIVLGKAFFPERVKKWGSLPATGTPQQAGCPPVTGAPLNLGWRRAFVILLWHPYWGAELAEQAGASPLAVSLIRHHQEKPKASLSLEDRLLGLLRMADDES